VINGYLKIKGMNMLKINWKTISTVIFTSLTVFFSTQSFAVSFNNDFTQANDNTVDWLQLNRTNSIYPCLTAGTAANNTSASSNIPGCNYADAAAGLETPGSGSLRFTPAQTNKTGAILSEQTFPTSQGLDVTFTTYTYGGDSGGDAHGGADGMTFFMSDGALGAQVGGVNNLGAEGGAMGYSCSNVNGEYDGIEGAYLGLGMDSYGNFLNKADNTSTGIAAIKSLPSNNGFNSWGSKNYQPNRIGLRGAGNVRWNWLNANYPAFYPTGLTAAERESAVKNTCKTGKLWSYANATVKNITAMVVSGTTLTSTVANHGFVDGDTVSLGGTTTATPAPQNVTSITSNSTDLVVSVPSVVGYTNNQSVTLGGSITTTQGITSIAYEAGPPKRVKVTPISMTGYSVGQSIIISGVTGTNASRVTGTFSITSVGATFFYFTVASDPGSIVVTNAKLSATIAGSYSIKNINTVANTFEIGLPYTPKSTIVSSSPTVTGPTPIVSGNYIISNATTNTFDVTLGSAAATVTNTSGNATNVSQNGAPGAPVKLATSVKNYAAIPGGFWALPDDQLIANQGTSTRTGAWPITYRLRITPAGLLTYQYSYNGGEYQKVLTNFPITTFNGPLPASVRFGFSAATGGSTNVHELSCFVAEPIISNSSASGNIIQGQQVKTTTKVFLASYDPDSWSGSVAAYAINNSAGTLSVSSTADWDTNCVLTGGACQSMDDGTTVPTVAVQAPSARNLFTYSGSVGIPLQWANLTAAQKAVLNDTDNAGQDRLDWLRGDRTKEQLANGILRARAGVMGDIINSSPTWVGPPSQNYASPFNDKLYASSNAGAAENNALAETYATFAANNKTRPHIVYTGSNDGILHGSRAGANDSGGNYSAATTANDGREVLGFIPATVLANSNVVDLTKPTYSHYYFTDAAPGYGDLFYGNAWHTWMVGGLGAGGAEVYALDITNPANFTETAANASTLVKGSWTPANLTTCVNFTNTSTPVVTTCGTANMGNSYGTPIIRRLHNGKWAVIFGNGIGSAANSAGVFVGLVDSSSTSTGAITSWYWLDSFKNGTASNPNGISYVTSADVEGDRISDYIYGGDLQGNVWRFDLTSSNPADWRVTDYSNPADAPGTVRANPSPLFKAISSAGNAQPITTKIAVTETYIAGAQRVILGFATGQAKPSNNSSAATYTNGAQTVYGIWDWNFNKWNVGTTTVAGVVIPAAPIAMANLSSAPSTQPIARSMLSSTSDSARNLFVQTSTSRGLKLNTVCWQGSTACGTTNDQYGWLFDLPDTVTADGVTGYEQVVYNPTFSAGQLLLNTTVPAVKTVGQCKPTLPTGWTMSFNIESGGGTANSTGQIVDVLGSGAIAATYSEMGLKLNGVGSPFVVSVGSQPQVITQTNTGKPEVKKFSPQGGVSVKRISWEQLR
jgi:type IV pilus assembly protein PilY1